MAVTISIPGKVPGIFANKEVDWDTDVFHLIALSAAATYNQDTTDYLDDVIANEVTGTNWAAGGVVVTTIASAYAAKTTTFDAVDVSQANVTMANVRHFILVCYSPASNATRPIIVWIDLGADNSWVAQPVQVAWAATGVYRNTVP